MTGFCATGTLEVEPIFDYDRDKESLVTAVLSAEIETEVDEPMVMPIMVIGVGEIGVDLFQLEGGSRVTVIGSLIACTTECTPNFGVVISQLMYETTNGPIAPHACLKLERERLATTIASQGWQ